MSNANDAPRCTGCARGEKLIVPPHSGIVGAVAVHNPSGMVCAARLVPTEAEPVPSEPCPDCEGNGILGITKDGKRVACERCGGHEDARGAGYITPSEPAAPVKTRCTWCHGYGFIDSGLDSDECSYCSGIGWLELKQDGHYRAFDNWKMYVESVTAPLRSRIAELHMHAYKWMAAHDSLAAGEPYEYPSPVDLPNVVAERDRLRDRLRLIAYFYDSGGNGKLNTALLDMGVKFADEEPTAMKMCKLAEAALKESQ